LSPVQSFSLQSAYAENPDSLFQENFTDYLLSWLRSGSKAPQATLQTNLAHPPPWSPSRKDPPGATFIYRASKTGLPGPIHSTHTTPEFPSNFPSPWRVFNSASSSSQYSFTS
ncbi:hypothetical protein ATANTOWER_032842, partial [Ataeniobius toweri]|nr:hypothetical protein [Ataeniobius toweri]